MSNADDFGYPEDVQTALQRRVVVSDEPRDRITMDAFEPDSSPEIAPVRSLRVGVRSPRSPSRRRD